MVKVRLNYLLFLLFGELFLVSACIPKSHLQRQYDIGYNRGINQCQETHKKYVDYLEKDLALKTAKLKRFNLVDEKGHLRSTDQAKEKDITGLEEWQK